MPARPAAGTFLEMGDDTTGAVDIATDNMTEVALVTDIGGPEYSKGSIDATHLRSTSKESIPDIPDGGETSLSLQMDGSQTTHQNLEADAASNAIRMRNFHITWVDGSIRSFKGFVQSFSISSATGAVVTGECTLKISGDVTRTYPA